RSRSGLSRAMESEFTAWPCDHWVDRLRTRAPARVRRVDAGPTDGRYVSPARLLADHRCDAHRARRQAHQGRGLRTDERREERRTWDVPASVALGECTGCHLE